MSNIPFFHCNLPDKDAVKRALCATIDSGRLSDGAQVAMFEGALEDYLGVGTGSVVTTKSGTSALHLALATLGVGPGDEVIVPPQTFIATALAVMYCGAKPVFCDVDRYTGLMTADTLLDAVTARTVAAIPVHWGGLACDMQNIKDAAEGQGLFVIEDAAQAIGTSIEPEARGDAVCYSFQATKHLTCGDGGAVWFRRERDADKARRLRWFGISKDSPVGELGEREYELTEIGYKYHMNEVAASIGLANLPHLDNTINHHLDIVDLYCRGLENTSGIKVPDMGTLSPWWFYPLLVDRRDDFARAMKWRGVPVSVVHRRIDRHTRLFGEQRDLPGATYFDAHQINLPVHCGMSIEDAEWICEQVNKVW